MESRFQTIQKNRRNPESFHVESLEHQHSEIPPGLKVFFDIDRQIDDFFKNAVGFPKGFEEHSKNGEHDLVSLLDEPSSSQS